MPPLKWSELFFELLPSNSFSPSQDYSHFYRCFPTRLDVRCGNEANGCVEILRGISVRGWRVCRGTYQATFPTLAGRSIFVMGVDSRVRPNDAGRESTTFKPEQRCNPKRGLWRWSQRGLRFSHSRSPSLFFFDRAIPGVPVGFTPEQRCFTGTELLPPRRHFTEKNCRQLGFYFTETH